MLRRRNVAVAILCLVVASSGCSAGGASGSSEAGQASAADTAADLKALAADYMKIARTANHRLDVEVGGYEHNVRRNLALAESNLRAQAATERNFDQLLLKIPFPPAIEAIARALVRANQRRIAFTLHQARSPSIAVLASLIGAHHAADAAVEVQVRMIRRALGLPPPSTS